MKFKLFGLGGCGINIVGRYTQEGHYRRDIEALGLDTSDANIKDSVGLKVERVPGVSGSGSVQDKHADRYTSFLQKIITQYEPGDITVLVYSASGGSGSSMGTALHRLLLERHLPVISVVIGDRSTITEATNSVRCLLNLNDHTETGNPVIFSYYENTVHDTHGKINADAVGFIDSIRLMLGDDNIRVDRTDVYHLFFYNRVVKAAPVLSSLSIISGDEAQRYEGKAVAAISLHDQEDNITQVFPQLLYRKAGIFGPTHNVSGYDSLHAVLDHGDSLKRLQTMLAEQRRTNAEVNDHYQNVENRVADAPVPPVGNFRNYDI